MQGIIKNLKRLLVLAALALALATALMLHLPRPAGAPRTGPSLADVRTWGYQLQRATAARMPAAIDMLVIDYARGNHPTETLSAAEVQRFRTRPDGSKRIVLAYLSVGEAENYRYYWWSHWRSRSPAWLADENPEWKGNYRVRFWEPGWRSIIMNPRPTLFDYAMERAVDWHKPYLDRILEAGFDGVYLDRVDAFTEWQPTRPSAETDMANLVVELASYAKAQRPGFLVVTQNGEELLRHADVRRVVDAAAKEDLWFGIDGAEVANNPRDISRTIQHLGRMRTDGKPVFVVEYLDGSEKRESTRRLAAERGYVLTFAARQLDTTPQVIEPIPGAQSPPATGGGAPASAVQPATPPAVLPSRPIAPTPARPKG